MELSRDFVMKASQSLAEVVEENLKTVKGYEISGYGMTFDEKTSDPIISMKIAYTGIWKFIKSDGFRLQEAYNCIPDTFDYEGKTIPVQKAYVISSSFL